MDILNMPSKKLKQQPSYFKMTKPEQKPSLMGCWRVLGVQEKPGAAALATTDICDAHPDLLASGDLRLVPQVFQKYGKWQAFAGPVVTLKVFEDNTLVIELLSTKGEGRVLVVDGGGSMRRAVTGGMLARSAEIMGWVWPKACSCKYWRGLDSRGRMVVCGWRWQWHPCLLIRTVYLNPN
ncbi:PREDICTED: ribonuclease [Prunus dulcis]|uniref:PREDICTED: ribonuclease n=1 Tax=Prunus dulcis TaxID=3755 RepID=A0A5E4G815_PRUDU|nr:PREDICTED: ribonuclease [Prunus dulcis]